MKFGDTTQILSEDSIVRVWLKNLDISIQSQVAPLRQIPETKNIAVKYDDISSYLFGKGVASDRINNLMSQIGELVRIAKWYNDSDKNKPSKVEIINYLVVPLPRTLGWTPQLMAIEWNNIDIALFSELPRKYGFLNLVVEVKKLNAPALSAFKQAKGYALKSKKCRRVIVTDGLRYGVFTKNRKKGIFSCRIYEFDTPPQ